MVWPSNDLLAEYHQDDDGSAGRSTYHAARKLLTELEVRNKGGMWTLRLPPLSTTNIPDTYSIDKKYIEEKKNNITAIYTHSLITRYTVTTAYSSTISNTYEDSNLGHRGGIGRDGVSSDDAHVEDVAVAVRAHTHIRMEEVMRKEKDGDSLSLDNTPTDVVKSPQPPSSLLELPHDVWCPYWLALDVAACDCNGDAAIASRDEE
jgi:hypothetical protein